MTQSLFILWRGCILLKLVWKGQAYAPLGAPKHLHSRKVGSKTFPCSEDRPRLIVSACVKRYKEGSVCSLKGLPHNTLPPVLTDTFPIPRLKTVQSGKT